MLSVAIITYNEEENIRKTLEAVKNLADEIIVVDSFSTDKTVDIAKEYGARIYLEKFKGFIDQKNSAMEKCSNEWILFLDADEVVTQALRKSIINALSKNEVCGYIINRRTFYLGKLLKYSWQPDRNLRLVHKSLDPKWGKSSPHEKLYINGESEILEGEIIHYSYKNLNEHIQKLNYYAQSVAQNYYINGRHFKLHNILLNPFLAFFKKYLFKLGFLDGYRGFFVAASSFIYVFLKYAYLWEINKTKKRKIIR